LGVGDAHGGRVGLLRLLGDRGAVGVVAGEVVAAQLPLRRPEQAAGQQAGQFGEPPRGHLGLEAPLAEESHQLAGPERPGAGEEERDQVFELRAAPAQAQVDVGQETGVLELEIGVLVISPDFTFEISPKEFPCCLDPKFLAVFQEAAHKAQPGLCLLPVVAAAAAHGREAGADFLPDRAAPPVLLHQVGRGTREVPHLGQRPQNSLHLLLCLAHGQQPFQVPRANFAGVLPAEERHRVHLLGEDTGGGLVLWQLVKLFFQTLMDPVEVLVELDQAGVLLRPNHNHCCVVPVLQSSSIVSLVPLILYIVRVAIVESLVLGVVPSLAALRQKLRLQVQLKGRAGPPAHSSKALLDDLHGCELLHWSFGTNPFISRVFCIPEIFHFTGVNLFTASVILGCATILLCQCRKMNSKKLLLLLVLGPTLLLAGC